MPRETARPGRARPAAAPAGANAYRGGHLPRSTTPRVVRVACVDDDTLIREGISRLLPGVIVTGAFDRVEAFLDASPDVDAVLLDLWLRDWGADPGAAERVRPDPFVEGASDRAAQGAAGVSAVSGAGYRTLIYTNERRRLVLAGCLAAGATGIIHKSEPLPVVVDAVHRVARGEMVVTTALAGLAEVVQRRGGLPSLSPRQLDVLRGRARGETYKSIAARLSISPKTAEEYMGEVSRRFSTYLRERSAADLERHLGIGSGDLLDRG